MCHFVTLIAPTEDAAALCAVMERYGRTAISIDNLSVNKMLREGEHQFITTHGHCDCGTVLAPRHDVPEDFDNKLARDAARLKRKGWSDAKVARAIEDRRKADARPRGGGADSIEIWSALLRDIGKELSLPYAGLLVRFYSGALNTETFTVTRREVSVGARLNEALGSLCHDEVTIFPLR